MQEDNRKKDNIILSLRMFCLSLFAEKSCWQKECHEVIEMFEGLFEKYSSEELQTFMSGEFPFANGMDERKTRIPMYLYMELLAGVLETKYGKNPKYKEVDFFVAKFREFREKTVHYPHDERFDPEKHLAEGLIGDIVDAMGFITLGTTNIGDKKVVSISCTATRDSFRQRSDGEYIPTGSSTKKSTYPCLYEEDAVAYRKYQKQEEDKLRESFGNITGGYFEGGCLPIDSHEFDEMLKDEHIHPNILSILRTIRRRRNDFPAGKNGELLWMMSCKNYLNGIRILEKEAEQASRKEMDEQGKKETTQANLVADDEERKLAIKAARKRYSTQNPLLRWCREIIGKQQRFDGIEFDDLSVAEINGLFSSSKKGKNNGK